MRPFPAIRGKPFGFLTILLISVGSARAQAPVPAGPLIHKLTIATSGGAPVVRYYTSSDSPRLQSLCRTLQWAENEVTIVDQLQQLKMEYVDNERRLAALRTAQALNPGMFPAPSYHTLSAAPAESALSIGLAGVLADEATPERAIQLLQLLEKAQTDLAEELKKMTPRDRGIVEGDTKALDKAIILLRAKRDAAARRTASPPNRAAPAPPARPPAPPQPGEVRFVSPSLKPFQAAMVTPPTFQRPVGDQAVEPKRDLADRQRKA
ncbi:MAG TPA: hypothetical protein VKD72_16075, partial [Gemmataceae bacterium]|nr:hypothetical protein [Gemmataceae bacterium]